VPAKYHFWAKWKIAAPNLFNAVCLLLSIFGQNPPNFPSSKLFAPEAEIFISNTYFF